MKNISRRQFTQASIAMALGATGSMAGQVNIQEQEQEDWMHPWNLKTDFNTQK